MVLLTGLKLESHLYWRKKRVTRCRGSRGSLQTETCLPIPFDFHTWIPIQRNSSHDFSPIFVLVILAVRYPRSLEDTILLLFELTFGPPSLEAVLRGRESESREETCKRKCSSSSLLLLDHSLPLLTTLFFLPFPSAILFSTDSMNVSIVQEVGLVLVAVPNPPFPNSVPLSDLIQSNNFRFTSSTRGRIREWVYSVLMRWLFGLGRG